MVDYQLDALRGIPERTPGPRRWLWLLIGFAVLMTVGWIVRDGIATRFAQKAKQTALPAEPPIADAPSKVLAKLKSKQELPPPEPVAAPESPPVLPPADGMDHVSQLKKDAGDLARNALKPQLTTAPERRAAPPAPKVLTEAEKDAKAYEKAREKARRGMTVWNKEKSADASTALSDVKQYASPYTVAAGDPMGCTLETGLTSDVGGVVKLRVRTWVYDTVTGRYPLIPPTAWFVGKKQANSLVYGDSRLIVTLDQLHWGNGEYLSLKQAAVSDQSGKAGLTQHIDRKWGQIIASVFLNTALRAGPQMAQTGMDNAANRALIGGLANETSRQGSQEVRSYLNTAPTIEVDPGYPCTVILEQNLSLAHPYEAHP